MARQKKKIKVEIIFAWDKIEKKYKEKFKEDQFWFFSKIFYFQFIFRFIKKVNILVSFWSDQGIF